MNSAFVATMGLGSSELLVILLALMFVLPLAAIPAILSYLLLDRIPAEHRKQEPGLALLLLIPLFSIIWAFFVYPRISESLQSFFASRNVNRGDCARGIAFAACVCGVCGLIPVVGILVGFASFVLLIVFFVKAFELSGEIKRMAIAPVAMPPPTPTV